MKNKNIVVIGLQSWDIGIGFNCKDIAIELSKNNRVLFVNRPVPRSAAYFNDAPFYKKRLQMIKDKVNPLQQLNDNLFVLTPPILTESIQRLPFKPIFNFFNKINNRRFARQILKYTKGLGFDDFILFNDNDMFNGQYLKELLNPSMSIYYIRDYLICQDYFKRNGIDAERELIKKSDLIVANSVFLKEYAHKYNSNSRFIGQGCDLSIFNAVQSDNQVVQKSRKTIGYTGVLSAMRLDHDLMYALCKTMPEYDFSFVGPLDETFKESPLHLLKNVTFHGLHPKQDMPSFIKTFDVCINPQAVNMLTKGNYPLKIDEYLAMGKPIVSTKTLAMDMFKEHVYLAENLNDYIQMIQQAIQLNSPEKEKERKAFASSHTWENSVGLLTKYINQVA